MHSVLAILAERSFYSVINYMLLLVRASLAGDLQSLSWSSMAVGGICGSLFGGIALSSLPIDAIFLLFSILPCIQLLSCCFVKENSVNIEDLVEDSTAKDTQTNGSSNSRDLDEDSPLAKKSNSSTRKRKKGKKNTKGKAVNARKSKVLDKGDSLATKSFHSLKKAIYDLCRAFRQPMILRYIFENLSAYFTFKIIADSWSREYFLFECFIHVSV